MHGVGWGRALERGCAHDHTEKVAIARHVPSCKHLFAHRHMFFGCYIRATAVCTLIDEGGD